MAEKCHVECGDFARVERLLYCMKQELVALEKRLARMVTHDMPLICDQASFARYTAGTQSCILYQKGVIANLERILRDRVV